MIKKDITGMSKKEQLLARSKDRLYHFVLAGGQIRGAILHGTHMMREMRAGHQLGILETLILGHAYLGVSLMTANLKGDDRVAFKVECSGPVKGLSVEATAHGEVRGYLKVNPIPIDKAPESFDTAPFFGTGFLAVTRFPEFAKQPYVGQVKLESGRLASDLSYYYSVSEQTPTSVNLSIRFDKEGNVTGAGGLLLQALPEAGEELIDQLELLAYRFPPIGDAFETDKSPEEMVMNHFEDLFPKLLVNRRVEFFCPCSMESVGNVIASLPEDTLKDIMENGPFPVESICHNCNSVYRFQKEEIEEFYQEKISG
ncbi:MAG: Hsp33 family molecular chaperone HslO [bacterium]|nr:Hsp33 family molecular chaperone HslO [bacterium]